jgi:hypothetical protein
MAKLLFLALLAAGCALPGSAFGGGGTGLRVGSGTGIRLNDNASTFGQRGFHVERSSASRSAAAGRSAAVGTAPDKTPKTEVPQPPSPPKKPEPKK